MSAANEPLLRRLEPDRVASTRSAGVLADEVRRGAERIVEDVRARGEPALREYCERFGDVEPGAALVLDRGALLDALHGLEATERALLERTADRIHTFAVAQRAALRDVRVRVPGGWASHEVVPIERAGCYAPGGRYPLPSSALMTAVTARAAGVGEIWVASPRPAPITCAAAAIAGADGLLCAGGAQGIAALAFGTVTPAVDFLAGPGNAWVTAAKQRLAGEVGIDMLAGPSELVVIADAHADAGLVAADLLAQAEHDDDALPILLTDSPDLAARVEAELERQLETLPTADTARRALRNGFACVCADLEQAASVSDRLAPEHLELAVADARALAQRVRHYGALFVGSDSAEALGDYGAGPNHVLPTGGGARFGGGLSALSFVRVRTRLEIDDPALLVPDVARFAELEGLHGHRRSAEWRLAGRGGVSS